MQVNDKMVEAAIPLDDCPEGLFLFNGYLGFMTEYATLTKGFRQRDAYVVESGEYFWGGTATAEARAKLLVQPISGEHITSAFAHREAEAVPDMDIAPDGPFVRHSDYEALERENERLTIQAAVTETARRAAERRNAELEAALDVAAGRLIWAAQAVPGIREKTGKQMVVEWAEEARAALAGSGGGWHLCGCPEMGTYEGQIILVAPEWLKDKWPNGIGIDVCLALEIQHLWRAGIRTSGHCCGHGQAPAFISVLPESIDAMKALGYSVLAHHDGAGREDHFVPKTPIATAIRSLLKEPEGDA